MGSHFCKCSVFITSSSPHTRQNSTKTFSSSALSTWWQVLNVYLIKITNRWMMCLIRDGLKAYRSDLTQLKWTKQFPHFRNSFCCTHTTPCGIPSKHIKGGESQFIYQLMESLLSLWSKLLNIPAWEEVSGITLFSNRPITNSLATCGWFDFIFSWKWHQHLSPQKHCIFPTPLDHTIQ